MSNKETLEEWYAAKWRKFRWSPIFWWYRSREWLDDLWWRWKTRGMVMEEIVANYYPDLLHTYYWDEHPEDWDDGCFCVQCRSYMANE